MRALSSVTPTDEQLKIMGVIRQGFHVIRGAAGSGKTSTALMCLKELATVRLKRHQRRGLDEPVRVLVLTFNRTLEGYIAQLARQSAPRNDALSLTISTFSRWARSLVGNVSIADKRQSSIILRPLLQPFMKSHQYDFLATEVEYVLGRFTPENLSDYLGARRNGRGSTPRMLRPMRERLLKDVLPAYESAKRQLGIIDWNDLALHATHASSDLVYDVVIVDESQDFFANQVLAVLSHLHPSHSTTFIVDATQRIYPRYFKWSEVGIRAHSGNVHALRDNYRNTAAIAAFARPLVDGLPAEDDGTLPDFTTCRRSGPKPVVMVGKYSSQLNTMLDRLARITDFKTESVALLQFRGRGWFSEARAILRRRGIPFCELTSERQWPSGPEEVALCTISSAKGLEFDHVLLPGLSREVTPHGAGKGDADLEIYRRMLAMAIGRARKTVMAGFKPREESSLISFLDPSTYEIIKV